MKKYVVKYGGFANVYTLAYTETPEHFTDALKHGYERITRKEAEHMCAVENWRREHDQAFSGFGDNRIYPYDTDFHDSSSDEFVPNGYIMERR